MKKIIREEIKMSEIKRMKEWRPRNEFGATVSMLLAVCFCFALDALVSAEEKAGRKKSADEITAELKAAKSQEEKKRLWDEMIEALKREDKERREAAASVPSKKWPETYEKRIQSGDGRCTAVISAKFVPNIGDGGGYSGRGSTFQYIDKAGKILWEKKDVDIHDRSCVISHNGKRVLLVEVRDKVDEEGDYTGDLEIYNKEPVLYDEKGNAVWSFGTFRQVYEVYLTQNGKYGYFRQGDGIIFFDVEKKQIHKTKSAYHANITEDGRAIVYESGDSLEVYENGVVYFCSKGRKDGLIKFEKPYKDLTTEDFKYLTAEEIKKVKEAVKEKKRAWLHRDKVIYEYQFK